MAMKTYIICIASKIGTTIHPKAFLSRKDAMKECHRITDEHITALVQNGVTASKKIVRKNNDEKVIVELKNSTMLSCNVCEVETDCGPMNAGTIEVLPWDEEAVVNGIKGRKGYYYKVLQPSCDMSICYIEASAFGNNDAISSKEDFGQLKGFHTMHSIREKMSGFIPGNDVSLIEDMTSYLLAKAEGESIEKLLETNRDTLEYMVSQAYKELSQVYLQPYNEDDESRPVTIISFRNCEDILVIDEAGDDQEVTLSEIYRLSDRTCPKCGKTLYHEKYANTETSYPYVCFECDENFYEFETEN